VFLFFVLFHQPTLHGVNENGSYFKKRLLFTTRKIKQKIFFKQAPLNVELSLYYQLTYGFFIICALYTNTFLPYGRFYNRLGGNVGMLFSYMYVFAYLSITSLRRPY